jgi:hypothetical protein
VFDVVAEGEEPTAEGGAARGAVGDGRALARQDVQLALGRVHVMGQHGCWPEQTVPVVGVDVVDRVWEKPCDRSDLGQTLIYVRGE